MYKLIDKQGMGTMEKRQFATTEDVRIALINYHSADCELNGKETLEHLLELGDWELESKCVCSCGNEHYSSN